MRNLYMLAIVVFAITASAAAPPQDGLVQAISDAAAYRSRIEAIALRAKAEYDPSGQQYQNARTLYNNVWQQNSMFVESMLKVLGGQPPDEDLCDDAAAVTIMTNDYVTQMGQQRGFADRTVAVIVPPFVRLLVAILSSLHHKSLVASVQSTLAKQLTWTPWEEL